MDFDEEQNEETDQPNEDVEMADKVRDREAHEFRPSINGSSHDRRLFVGGISRMTTEESFREYFSKFGQVADSVLMCDKDSGRRRGFGFVIYADPETADKVLKENHTIDGKKVDVEKALTKTTRIYVGGLPLSLTEDELKEYFSSYGYVVDHCIVLDRTTGRSGCFGFVSFDKEEAVEKVLSNGHMHELRGKQVEIKRSKPKRDCVEHTSESRIHHGGSGSKSYYSDGGSVEAFGGGYGGNMGSGYGGYGGYEGYGDYGGYGKFAGSYGVSPTGFYPGYGYGFWFGGAMYGAAGYEGSTYGIPAYYGGGSGYGNRGNGSNDGGYGKFAGSYGASPTRFYPGYGYGFWFGGAMYGAAGYEGSTYGIPAYYGGGSGYGNRGNGLNDGGNGGYGGGGGNGAYAYGNAGAANGKSVPAYYGGGNGYGNSGNGSNDGGNRGYGGGGGNGAYAYGNAAADNGRSVSAYYGGGNGYGNSGNGSNDGGNRGYGGGGGNGAYAYGNAAADNGRSVPAYYGGGSDDGSRGNSSNDGGNGGYGGGAENGDAGADNGRSHPSLK